MRAQETHDCNKYIAMRSVSAVDSRMEPRGVVLNVLAKLVIPTPPADSLEGGELDHIFPPPCNPISDSCANTLRQGERLWRLGKTDQIVEIVAEPSQEGGSAQIFITQMQAPHSGTRLSRRGVQPRNRQTSGRFVSTGSCGRPRKEVSAIPRTSRRRAVRAYLGAGLLRPRYT